MRDREPTAAELATPGVIYHPSFDPRELRTVDQPPTSGTPVFDPDELHPELGIG